MRGLLGRVSCNTVGRRGAWTSDFRGGVGVPLVSLRWEYTLRLTAKHWIPRGSSAFVGWSLCTMDCCCCSYSRNSVISFVVPCAGCHLLVILTWPRLLAWIKVVALADCGRSPVSVSISCTLNFPFKSMEWNVMGIRVLINRWMVWGWGHTWSHFLTLLHFWTRLCEVVIEEPSWFWFVFTIGCHAFIKLDGVWCEGRSLVEGVLPTAKENRNFGVKIRN